MLNVWNLQMNLDHLLKKTKPVEEPPQRNRRSLLPVFAKGLGGIATIAMALLFWRVFGDHLLPPAKVVVETVVTVESKEALPGPMPDSSRSRSAGTGGVLFQSSGWLEADPLPTKVSVLISGFVAEVLVLEGQTVQKDQLIARLISEDAEIDVRGARAQLAEAEGNRLQSAALLKVNAARKDSLEAEIQTERRRMDELADLAERARKVGVGLISEREVVQAELRLQTQEARVLALQERIRELDTERESLQGAVQVAEARLRAAEAHLAERQLALDRTQIRSPMDGIVQKLWVVPGSKRMTTGDNPDSATIATVFDPQFLQARIDIPLEEASAVRVGQAVTIVTDFLGDMEFAGQVTRIGGQADLQRNTLEVKVRIDDPHPSLRPEMLCRARFLDALQGAETENLAGTSLGDGGRHRVFAPSEAILQSDNPEETFVWVVSPDGQRVLRRNVRLGSEQRGDFLVVTDGLRPGDRVVVRPLDGLRAGQTVRSIPSY